MHANDAGNAVAFARAIRLAGEGRRSLLTTAHEVHPVSMSALCEGRSPGEIADERGIAISTVRTQIRQIREKTGMRTITDLLRLASMLPPLMSIVPM